MRGTRSRKWPTNWGVLAPHMPPSSLTRRGRRCSRRRRYARFSRRITSIFFSHRTLVKLAPPRQTPVEARGKDREQGRMNQGLTGSPKEGNRRRGLRCDDPRTASAPRRALRAFPPQGAGASDPTHSQRERRDGRWRFALTHTARRVMATAKAWASRTCLTAGKERSAATIVHPAALASDNLAPCARMLHARRAGRTAGRSPRRAALSMFSTAPCPDAPGTKGRRERAARGCRK